MVWEFTDSTVGAYNYKDGNGNYVLWQGWPVNKFTRACFVFEKKLKESMKLFRSIYNQKLKQNYLQSVIGIIY